MTVQIDELDDKDLDEIIANGTLDGAKQGAVDSETMIQYYRHLFPWKYLFQWLNHGPVVTNDFAHREFAFTLPNDAYIRYLSFSNWEELKKEALNLCPSRFEVGPVYSANPRDRKTIRKSTFHPLKKELVFDIDMTDYDDVRTCCSKTNICEKCWPFITIAVQVLDICFHEDFGFKHILWVYSGRRGIHAWICDEIACSLDDRSRRMIASYLQVVVGNPQGGVRLINNLKRPLHPHLTRSLNILKSAFVKIVLEDQDPWASKEGAENLLKLLPDKDLASALRKKWEVDPERSSKNKWSDIDTVLASGSIASISPSVIAIAKQDIVLTYLYPRLDVEVSRHLNHLLKSPFCVHPGTSRVCVPIDIERMDSFNPLKVPTVNDLLQELDKNSQNDNGHGPTMETNTTENQKDNARGQSNKGHGFSTSLNPYTLYFKSFSSQLFKETVGNKRKHENLEF
ncbi:DNA primase catalytic subunit Spp1 [Schizosaccharomyces pombe]|uniref:DNA primase small subunit n=1 Tax=Schizosaccharomyces pombe (strain 972 / ATCC 24843) TaxID=284812 RepID=PRI1_SCHPO|nr:DNA primase catalytic subunit Spp1 [Schizosaccharomyces pombe]O14215.1 RecName: Full=DNA primase small subunit; AltName: Full=DNA primase 1 [Schizosaccharomyces pombe 972h-]CAB11078.1 DNA primase catalytic subunit Spp1 [Schizosaccharomyces pombe]|eukprot:NP_593765.1 DNA primase catalytic subunit Spp1 [Schizosaccharomyces pombe]